MIEDEKDQPSQDPEPPPADYEPPEADDVAVDDRLTAAAGPGTA